MAFGLRTKAMGLVAAIPGVHDITNRMRSREAVFSRAYTSQRWDSAESGSGRGSELGATEGLRSYLPELFARLRIETFIDAPCGDWNWMSCVDLGDVRCIGIDVVPGVVEKNRIAFAGRNVEFLQGDLTDIALPRADLILCRDCWVHLSYQDIAKILENFRRSGATWLLTSNSPENRSNENKVTSLSWRHLNLRLPPFDFPVPVESRKDHYSDTPFWITLWRLADLKPLRIA